jgi:hypothetical protein
MAVSVDLAKALDKAYEDNSLKEILDASPRRWSRWRRSARFLRLQRPRRRDV